MKVFTILTVAAVIATGSCHFTDPECPKHSAKITLQPNVDDCSSYWMCKNGFAIEQVCLDGKLFDYEKLACVDSQLAHCLSGNYPPSTITTVKPTTPSTAKPTTSTAKTTPSTAKTTPSTGKTTPSTAKTTPSTAKTTHSTIPPVSSTTGSIGDYPVYCPPQEGLEDNFLLPNPKDCHTFYHCAHGIPHLKKCPGILLFNPKKNVCDWPRSVVCHSGH